MSVVVEPGYEDVVCRYLCNAERRVPTELECTPLVIEPNNFSSSDFLQQFLEHNSETLVQDIARYGAVLLRGFEINSQQSLEKTILSIHGMRGMRDILFQLPGRQRAVANTQFVFPTSITSRLEKTGGSLKFDLFHSENYGFPDVPSYLTFLCVSPCRLGGETGMLNVAKLYASLSDDLKLRLESTACLVQLHSIPAWSVKYKISSDVMIDFVKSINLPIVELLGIPYVAVFKPSVFEHPITRERTLSVNFNWLPNLQDAVVDAFLADYKGIRWAAHRISWRSPLYRRLSRAFARLNKGSDDGIYVVGNSPLPNTYSLSDLLSAGDVRSIASAMRRCYSAFVWKKSDVLLVDNLKIAHTGMPGRGARALNIMMCNPLRFPADFSHVGYQKITALHQMQDCLGSELLRFGNYSGGPEAHPRSRTDL